MNRVSQEGTVAEWYLLFLKQGKWSSGSWDPRPSGELELPDEKGSEYYIIFSQL